MRSIKKSSRTCVVRDELAERMGSLFCGKATAVAACHWHAAKSRLSNPTRARVIMPEKSPSGWMGFFLAERVGFEPTAPLPVHLISSQGRYNHFDTAPYVCCSLSIIAGTGSKIKEIFRRFTCV